MSYDPEKSEDEVDPARELFIKYLAGMEVGDNRPVGMEEFRAIMLAIHADFNPAEDNNGTITDMTDKHTEVSYEYLRKGDESVVQVTRVS